MISPEKIGYAGIEAPTVVVAISDEGVQRRSAMFSTLTRDTFVLKEKSVSIPETDATVFEVDFKEFKVKRHDWALSSLGFLAKMDKGLTFDMIFFAVHARFNKKVAGIAMETVEKMFNS